jgi:hypothetical protein
MLFVISLQESIGSVRTISKFSVSIGTFALKNLNIIIKYANVKLTATPNFPRRYSTRDI